ncbi:hypothetical protein DL93DRAFT_2078175 [Clavulina sp. PMI_390]|nr:hypothetical protein DL93DRAFT_2078175 [Clavulina sp. PMI_390]
MLPKMFIAAIAAFVGSANIALATTISGTTPPPVVTKTINACTTLPSTPSDSTTVSEPSGAITETILYCGPTAITTVGAGGEW